LGPVQRQVVARLPAVLLLLAVQLWAAGSCLAAHPLDRELEAATAGLGPSAATAAIYNDYAGKWDVELNRVFSLLLAELPLAAQPILREAQRAWLRTRDADGRLLDAIYYPKGERPPSMDVSAHAYARLNLIRERALLLQHWRERHAEIGIGRASATD